ncbi:Firmicu-CTERM domain-containing protein [Anaerosporobacter mobilis DSM 15930]|jgi:uncharacterized protein (TIGR04145 family)|uniref:Firmicu-CTERM domain-containing protein n=1 Tax=Anaerosporobacter mobilis DSM 15930 TaxID=1120996 RepID=A0A1M7KZX8_9FIRM|nr:Firmicu-CTERM sorting domain-containing protein [Anaerosporobacter mobilis]SHM70777.1 Firmicu-CTERM domain-containing protein [Anaerosporobacter mobilis DSM 15930]
MKRSLLIICSLLLITQAIAIPTNAIASQTVDSVVTEEDSAKAEGADAEGNVTEEEVDREESNITEEENNKEESNVTEEDNKTEDNKTEDNKTEDNKTEDNKTEEESDIVSEETEETAEDLLEGIEDENLTYGGTIQVDGTYSDWNHIPHTDISWYSPNPDQVHQGALYLDGDILYGHYKMNNAFNRQMIVGYMELTINNSTKVGLTIQKGTSDGNIDWDTDMSNLPEGITTGLGVFYNDYPKYYMGESVFTVYDKNHSIGDEVEFAIDLNVISHITGIPVESMREIKLYNPNIGRDEIVMAGSSSGAVVGVIVMTAIAAGGVVYLKRRKVKAKA